MRTWNDYIVELTPPTTEEIRNARPLATVLPQDALTRAMLIAVTLCAGTERRSRCVVRPALNRCPNVLDTGGLCREEPNSEVNGHQPRQLTTFNSGQIFDFHWSLDGKRLLFTRGEISSDAVLISDLR